MTTGKIIDNTLFFQFKLAGRFHFTKEELEFKLAELLSYSKMNISLLTILK